MNKAFEKILERLEREIAGKPTPDEYNNGINRAYSIVQEVAEEYSRCDTNIPCYECGAYDKEKHFCPKYCKVIKATTKELKDFYGSWIPCSDRLPEEPFGCLVTVIDCEPVTQTDFENILPYFVGYDGESWNDEDGNEIPFEVIAWKPLPEPYKESD